MNTLSAIRRGIALISVSRDGQLQTVLTGTLLLLLFHHPSPWYLKVPMLVAGLVGLLAPPIAKNLYFWFIIASFQIMGVYQAWDRADNHKYLIAYWFLTLSITFALDRPADRSEYLRRTSRWLIALCMLFACGWKLCSSSYLDGSFFHWTMLTDGRFEWVTEALGGLTREQMAANHDAVDWLSYGHFQNIDLSAAKLHTTDRIRSLATMMTWWTVAIEAIVAAFFLATIFLRRSSDASRRSPWHRWRNVILLFFAISTYSIATVKGFGWILLLMGYAQCEEDESKSRLAYIGVFLLIQLYKMPYAEVASAIAGW